MKLRYNLLKSMLFKCADFKNVKIIDLKNNHMKNQFTTHSTESPVLPKYATKLYRHFLSLKGNLKKVH